MGWFSSLIGFLSSFGRLASFFEKLLEYFSNRAERAQQAKLEKDRLSAREARITSRLDSTNAGDPRLSDDGYKRPD